MLTISSATLKCSLISTIESDHSEPWTPRRKLRIFSYHYKEDFMNSTLVSTSLLCSFEKVLARLNIMLSEDWLMSFAELPSISNFPTNSSSCMCLSIPFNAIRLIRFHSLSLTDFFVFAYSFFISKISRYIVATSFISYYQSREKASLLISSTQGSRSSIRLSSMA